MWWRKKNGGDEEGWKSAGKLVKWRRDPYEVLGVSRDATQDHVKREYRKKALEYHPDRTGAGKVGGDEKNEGFYVLQEAYEILGDERRRLVYDKYGHAGLDAVDEAGALGQLLEVNPTVGTYLQAYKVLVVVAPAAAFFILYALRADGVTRISYYAVFAPLYVLYVLIGVPQVFIVSATRRVAAAISAVLVLVVLVLIPTRLEYPHAITWEVAFLPLQVLLLGVVGMRALRIVTALHRGTAEHKSTASEQSPPLAPLSPARLASLALSLLISILFTIQSFLFPLRLDYTSTLSWRLSLLPVWIWPFIELISISIGAFTSPALSEIRAQHSVPTRTIFLVIFLPNFLILVFCTLFFYPFIILLSIRLEQNSEEPPAYSAAVIITPFFVIITAIVSIVIFFPAILLAARTVLLRKFRIPHTPPMFFGFLPDH